VERRVPGASARSRTQRYANGLRWLPTSWCWSARGGAVLLSGPRAGGGDHASVIGRCPAWSSRPDASRRGPAPSLPAGGARSIPSESPACVTIIACPEAAQLSGLARRFVQVSGVPDTLAHPRKAGTSSAWAWTTVSLPSSRAPGRRPRIRLCAEAEPDFVPRGSGCL
jgi:hypothetical protein